MRMMLMSSLLVLGVSLAATAGASAATNDKLASLANDKTITTTDFSARCWARRVCRGYGPYRRCWVDRVCRRW